jgi:hypothetical protein
MGYRTLECEDGRGKIHRTMRNIVNDRMATFLGEL